MLLVVYNFYTYMQRIYYIYHIDYSKKIALGSDKKSFLDVNIDTIIIIIIYKPKR